MKPGWLDKEENQKRKSLRQERKFAEKQKGKILPSSGSRLKQNDVRTKKFSYELKLTSHKSFTVKVEDIDKMILRAEGRMPVMVVEFESGLKLAILEWADFERLKNSFEE